MDNDLISAFIESYGPTVGFIAIITVAIIGILRFGIKFDVNEFLSTRKKRHLALARSYCPHMRLTAKSDGVAFQPLFYSPSGTLDWICSQCGARVAIAPDEEEMREMAEYFVNNPKVYKKRMSRYQRHMRKAL